MASRKATDQILREILFPLLAKQINESPRILNIGMLCGNTTEEMAKSQFPNCEYKTLDVDPALRPDFCLNIQADSGLVRRVGTFDVIIVTSVFIFLSKPSTAFQNLVQCLKSNGHLLIEMDAFNNRGRRFLCEGCIKDLEQSRYVFNRIFEEEYFLSRFGAFCNHHGIEKSKYDRLKVLSLQSDGKRNACVWSLENIFNCSYFQVQYFFNHDEERPLGCSYLLDVKLREPLDSKRQPCYIHELYKPPVLYLRRVLQLGLRSLYFGKRTAKKLGNRSR